MKWRSVKLETIVVNLDSKRKPLNDLEREKITKVGLYPYIGANNIMGHVDEYLFDEPILCLAEDGGSWGAGQRCAVIYEGKTWVNNHAHVLKATKELCLKYLMYFLNYADLNKYISGSTRGKLTKTSLNNIDVPLPPLHIQEQIADTLNKADALRRKDQELLTKYDELSQAIFYDMFGDPETNPKGWPCLPLEKITYKLGDGLHGTPIYDENGDYFFINGNNLIEGKITLTNNAKRVGFSEFSKHKKDLNNDSILVSINGTIGKVAFYNNEKIILGKSACYFNINRNKVVPQYMYHLISSPYFIKYAMSEATGSTIKNVSLKSMRNFSVPLPPIELQKKFENYISLQKAGYLKQNIGSETVNRLYQSLQTEYFS